MRILLLGLVLCVGCFGNNELDQVVGPNAKSARGSEYAIATAHPLASKAAEQVMELGGNAADALVTASFVLSVVRPQSTGIGGGGFLLHSEGGQAPMALDFRERAPLAATKHMFLNENGLPRAYKSPKGSLPRAAFNGHFAAGVPGLVSGLYRYHQKYGSMPWSELVRPAIEIASDGFQVYPSLVRALKWRKEVVMFFDATAEIFAPEGRLLEVGDILVQKDLAKTLQAIAEDGEAGFYEGWVKDLFLKEMRSGIIRDQDFVLYKPIEREPITAKVQGFDLYSFPPPSSGGLALAQMLKLADMIGMGPRFPLQSAPGIHKLAEIMRLAYADRAQYIGDPDFEDIPVEGILTSAYLKLLSRSIPNGKAGESEIKEVALPKESSNTTHISIVDAVGNAVSSTQTINGPLGSGVVVEGTGIILNNEMGDFSINPGKENSKGVFESETNAIAPRKTMMSSMTPTILFDSEGVHTVIGSPGGPRIINAVFQTLVGTIFYELPLNEAVSLPRIHHQWQPNKVYYEQKFPITQEVMGRLTEMGYELEESSFGVGDVQAVGRTSSGWLGVSDGRSDGVPVAH